MKKVEKSHLCSSASSGTVRLLRESRAPAAVTELYRVKADSAAADAGLRSNVPADLGLMLPETCYVSLCTRAD